MELLISIRVAGVIRPRSACLSAAATPVRSAKGILYVIFASAVFCGVLHPASLPACSSLSWSRKPADFTGFLYVSDYKAADLDRYSYTTPATNTISNITPAGQAAAPRAPSSSPAGSKRVCRAPTTTSSSSIPAATTLTRYDLNGNNIGTISVKNADNSAHTFNSIGNVAHHAGRQISVRSRRGRQRHRQDRPGTGKIVGHTAFTGAHDLAITADGTHLCGGLQRTATPAARASRCCLPI